jgi:hypothetical protein
MAQLWRGLIVLAPFQKEARVDGTLVQLDQVTEMLIHSLNMTLLSQVLFYSCTNILLNPLEQ